MIIRDLDHCELEAQINKLGEIEGGRSTLIASFNTLAQGLRNSSVQSYFDSITIQEQGLSLSGYSYVVLQTAN